MTAATTTDDLARCTYCQRVIQPRPSRLTEGVTVWELAQTSTPGPNVCWSHPGTDKSHEPTLPVEVQVEQALTEIEQAVATCKADGLGANASESDLYYELANSVLVSYPAPVANRVRARLGFDPRD